jgi:aminoglycoside phosphotransferase (APT) family kinase protein
MGIPRAEVNIDESVARQLLAAQHPDLADLELTPIAAGWDNAMFRLGEDLAIRLPRRQLAAALVLHEQRWLPQLAPRVRVKIPVPIRVGLPQGDYPWHWSVVPWIDGETADISPPGRDQSQTLAEFLEALHRPAPSDAPRNPYRGVPLAQREAGFREYIARLHGRSDALDKSALDVWAEALAAPVGTEPTWIHGDLHPRNVLCRDGRITGIIDWGDLAQGDSASDLAAIWLLLPDLNARRDCMAACATVSPDAWIRAKGWAVLYAAIFLDAALESDPHMTAMAHRTLERLKAGP